MVWTFFRRELANKATYMDLDVPELMYFALYIIFFLKLRRIKFIHIKFAAIGTFAHARGICHRKDSIIMLMLVGTIVA